MRQITERDPMDNEWVKQRLRLTMEDGRMSVLSRLSPTPQRMLLQLRDMLKRSDTPKLVLAGAHDKLALVREQRTISELLPSTRYAEIDCGFMVPLVRPLEAATAVALFFDGSRQSD
jgi:pimeloyl-ACP methyl ester carboxylesterase